MLHALPFEALRSEALPFKCLALRNKNGFVTSHSVGDELYNRVRYATRVFRRMGRRRVDLGTRRTALASNWLELRDSREKRMGMATSDTEDIKTEEKADGWLKRTIRRLGSDDLFRESFFSSIGACVNLVLAIMNGINGFTNHSAWSQSMSLYFLALGLITLYIAFCIGRPQGRSARTVMRQCGVCLIIAGVAMASFMYLYVIGHEVMLLTPGFAWALTILTIVLAVLAVYNTYLFRKSDPVRHAFQRVTLAASIGGIVMLEIQLLATFGGGLDPALVVAIETVTAIIAVAILVVFGGSLLVKAQGVEDVAM